METKSVFDDMFAALMKEKMTAMMGNVMTKVMEAAIESSIDMLSDVPFEKVREMTEKALSGAWDNILSKRKKTSMTKEEFLALGKESPKRTLTKEEFLALEEDDESDLFYTNTYPERAERSKLYELGYSVSQEGGLSDRYRQDLLESIIRSGQMTKGHIISHLYHLIKINGQKGTNDIAVAKWKRDLEFVRKL